MDAFTNSNYPAITNITDREQRIVPLCEIERQSYNDYAKNFEWNTRHGMGRGYKKTKLKIQARGR